VFDLDAISLLRITKGMRDSGAFASGRKLDVAPNLFIGATANPFVPPFRDRIDNLEKKIDAARSSSRPSSVRRADDGRFHARGAHPRAAQAKVIIVGVGI
jgi:hypothetical protein